MRILINCLHTHTGGGLSYINGLLPQLVAHQQSSTFILLCQKRYVDKFNVPHGVQVKAVVPPHNFLLLHVYEQLIVPFLARWWGCTHTLCNANYAPLFAPRPSVILHNDPRVGAHNKGRLKEMLYWPALKMLTRLSIWCSKVSFAVAQHIIEHYTRNTQKLKLTPPGAPTLPAGPVLPRDTNLVVAVGDFYVQKNYPLLIDAFAILAQQRPATKFEIIGKAVDSGVAKNIHAKIAQHKLEHKVRLIESLAHDQLLNRLRHAAVFVSSSSVESFCLPVLESMACGTPMVLADLPHFRTDIAGDTGAVYINISNGGDIPAAFAVGLYGVLENPEIAAQLANTGLARAAHFSWQNTADVIVKALHGEL